jgi:hypothetical protein
MLAAYLVCAAVRPDPSLVDEDSTVVILDPEVATQLGIHAADEGDEGDAPSCSGDDAPRCSADAALLVIPLIVVAMEADQVIRHSRKYLQMLDLDACKVVLASGQDALNRAILPDLASLPDGLVGRFDTVVALQRDDEAAIKQACDFLRSIFTAEDDRAAAERRAP